MCFSFEKLKLFVSSEFFFWGGGQWKFTLSPIIMEVENYPK